MYLWLIYTFVFILDFSLELEQEETDSINKLLYTLNHKCEYYHKLDNMFHHTIMVLSLLLWIHHITTSGAITVGFTTTCTSSAFPHYCCEFEPRWWQSVVDTTLCEKVCQWLAADLWFFPGTPVSSTLAMVFRETFYYHRTTWTFYKKIEWSMCHWSPVHVAKRGTSSVHKQQDKRSVYPRLKLPVDIDLKRKQVLTIYFTLQIIFKKSSK